MKKLALLFFLALLGNYALAAADFHIVSITLSPETIEEGSQNQIDVSVTVKNQGSTDKIGYLNLSEPQKSVSQTKPSPTKIAAKGGEYTFTFSSTDFATGVSTWQAGNYAFVAKACIDDTCANVQSQVTKTLTIKPRKRQPVPELNELLLPFIACFVLAIVLFSARKA